MKRTAIFATAALLALAGCTNNKDCSGSCSDEACDACQAEGAAATLSSASNDTCPFSGGPVSANATTVSFEGKDIGFCCNGCSSKFEKMSDEERAATLASN